VQYAARALRKCSSVHAQDVGIKRFVQLYNKNFKGNRNTRVGMLSRSDFLQKYKLLVKEMKDRNLTHAKVTDIDVEVFRKAMFGGLDVGTWLIR